MTGGVSMFARVTISRRIAAQCRAALLAGSKMDPGIADFHALGALAGFRLLDRIDRIEMRAAPIGHLRLLLFEAVSRR